MQYVERQKPPRGGRDGGKVLVGPAGGRVMSWQAGDTGGHCWKRGVAEECIGRLLSSLIGS